MGEILNMERDANLRMAALCRMFPTLRHDIPGTDPWDPEEFDGWASSGTLCHGALFAARFILAVWSGRAGRVGSKPRKTPEKDAWHGQWRFNVDTQWRCGPFDVVDALGTWDAAHREAFTAWARSPLWP